MTRAATTAGAPPRFDGWIVVAAVFLLLATSSGLGFYGLAIYLEAITDEQGFSTSSVSLATSMFFLVSAIVGRMMAGPIERGHTRRLVMAGGVVCGASLTLLGQVTAVWQLYVVYLMFATGFALSGLLPGTTLVTRWFHARRSVALAVASTGLSVGGLTVTQFASWWIDRRGLADATPWLGALFVILVGVAALFMWPDPASRGQRPDGAIADPQERTDADPFSGASYDQAISSRFFKTTTGGFFLTMAAQVGGIAHLANLGTDRVDRATGALAVLALALASVIFRLLGGVIAGRVPLAGYTTALAAAQGLSMVLLAESGSRAAIVIAAFFMGATVGNLLMLQALLVADAFGVGAYARIFSLNQLLVTFGVALGPFLLGALQDGVSYRLSYWIAGCLSMAGSIVFAAGGSVRAATARLAAG